VYLARGDVVSGCDLRASETTRRLEEKGATVSLGHDPGHVAGQDLVVYSAAARASAEVEAAARSAAAVLSRAEALAGLVASASSIAVAGTHGKTTVTLMLGSILVEAGLDPAVLVGDGYSSRAGGGWLVAEADESDGSLVLHRPRHALVTNLELDHPDHFRDLDAVREVFSAFLAALPPEGVAVTCADDSELQRLATPARRATYGFSAAAGYRCGEGRPFSLSRGGRELGRIELGVPGRHNVQNACGAAAMGLELGVPFAAVERGLAGFRGARRRLERLGSWRGAELYDDYGHHPTEVAATLQAARELPHRRLVLLFQPHRFTRLARMESEFARSLEGADRVVVLEVYPAGEPDPGGLSAASLAERVPGAAFAPDREAARRALEEVVGEGDLVLLMGAGPDPRRLGDDLARQG
jgi:UDP-N-acetylmuramate--alanine ligase